MFDTTAILRAGYACLAGFALVQLSASLASAEFGPRSIIGEEYQQTSTTTSFDGSKEGECKIVNPCYVLFQRAPLKKHLIIQHVSCFYTAFPSEPLTVKLRSRTAGQNLPLSVTHLMPVKMLSDASANISWYVLNSSTVKHLVEAPHYPVIELLHSRTANWTAECMISGQLITP